MYDYSIAFVFSVKKCISTWDVCRKIYFCGKATIIEYFKTCYFAKEFQDIAHFAVTSHPRCNFNIFVSEILAEFKLFKSSALNISSFVQ